MFVLGIDPGLTRCGYGAVERSGQAAKPVARAAGVIETDPRAPIPERLSILRCELDSLMAELSPDVVVVERVFFQTNVRTAMSVAQASGLALSTAALQGCTVAQLTANEVKATIVGYGAATKQQVQEMVARLLGLETVPRPFDVADALALALTYLATEGFHRAVAAASGVSR